MGCSVQIDVSCVFRSLNYINLYYNIVMCYVFFFLTHIIFVMGGLGFSCIHFWESWRKKRFNCKFLHWKGRDWLATHKVNGEEVQGSANTWYNHAVGSGGWSSFPSSALHIWIKQSTFFLLNFSTLMYLQGNLTHMFLIHLLQLIKCCFARMFSAQSLSKQS